MDIMDIIQNNPYRVMGLIANATEREIQRQKSKINKYSGIGKHITSEFDFPFLNNLERTSEISDKAFSCIEQNEEKVNYSLFWFINIGSIDETAIKYMSNGEKNKAIEIWEKVTANKEVTSKNYSYFNNLSTLKLVSSSKEDIKFGLELKFKLIESDVFVDFVHTVADETYTLDCIRQSEKIIDEVLLQNSKKLSLLEKLFIFEDCSALVNKHLKTKLAAEPISIIESQIGRSKKERKVNKGNASQIGDDLYWSTKYSLSTLLRLFGEANLQYQLGADNLSKEILQCGIDYFQEWKGKKDPSKESLMLFERALKIAVGAQTKNRINENIDGIKEWAKTAPIQKNLDVIYNELELFQEQSDSLNSAKSLVIECKSQLEGIKNTLGEADKFYLDISSAVANNALQMVIEVVNEGQSGFESDKSKILAFPDLAAAAVHVMSLINLLAMDSETRKRFTENNSTIVSLNESANTVRKHIEKSKPLISTDSGLNITKLFAYGIPMVIGTAILPIVGTFIGYFVGGWIYKAL
jgi:hypothetical protein